jgi:hypothetical protein
LLYGGKFSAGLIVASTLVNLEYLNNQHSIRRLLDFFNLNNRSDSELETNQVEPSQDYISFGRVDIEICFDLFRQSQIQHRIRFGSIKGSGWLVPFVLARSQTDQMT